MTIQHRLILLVAAAISALIIVSAIDQYATAQVSYWAKQRETILSLSTLLSEMRRYEKDFLLKKEAPYLEKHQQAALSAQTQFMQLDASFAQKLDYQQAVDQYIVAFKHLVQLKQAIGLTPETGLYGELRQAVHQAESLLKSHELLMGKMLMLRRNEKDFMLRYQEKYLDEFDKNYLVFMQALANAGLTDDEKQTITLSMQRYQQGFTKLVKDEKTVGLSYKEGVLNVMREKAHQAEHMNKTLLDASQVMIDRKVVFFEQMVLWASLLIILVLLLLAWRVIRAVNKPILALTRSLSEVAGRMQFDMVLPPRVDEFSDLVSAINILFYQLNQAIKEANQVVGAMANADFNQRMESDYVGDIQKFKVGINAAAESVHFMMTELAKVMGGLESGQFDIKMDARVPANFRKTVESAFDSIGRVVSNINDAMLAMSHGDFHGRIHVEAKGDLLMMKNNLNDSMQSLESAMEDITRVVTLQAQGDLTHAFSGRFKGQLNDTEHALNLSATKLKEVVKHVMQAASVVNDAAEQVSEGASALSQSVQAQAVAIDNTNNTMNQITVAVQANTDNAQRVASLTRSMQSKAEESVVVMHQTIDAMQSIREASNKIAEIVTLIDGIAFQTNLLALNAAVEAARAGEHGRGFAVVAGEVRALAQKAAGAANDIKHLIDDSVARVRVGTQLADKSGDMLNGIAHSIVDVANMVEQIATASKEQSHGIHEMHVSMSEIDRVTQENAARLEETTAAAESLSHEANGLRDSVTFFKTEPEAGRSASLKQKKLTKEDDAR